MKESVTYQAILREGKQEGIVEGKQLGERDLVLRLLGRRIGKVDSRLRKRLEQLSFVQLGDFGEALLDFTSREEVFQWLRQHSAKA